MRPRGGQARAVERPPRAGTFVLIGRARQEGQKRHALASQGHGGGLAIQRGIARAPGGQVRAAHIPEPAKRHARGVADGQVQIPARQRVTVDRHAALPWEGGMLGAGGHHQCGACGFRHRARFRRPRGQRGGGLVHGPRRHGDALRQSQQRRCLPSQRPRLLPARHACRQQPHGNPGGFQRLRPVAVMADVIPAGGGLHRGLGDRAAREPAQQVVLQQKQPFRPAQAPVFTEPHRLGQRRGAAQLWQARCFIEALAAQNLLQLRGLRPGTAVQPHQKGPQRLPLRIRGNHGLSLRA